TGAQRLFYTTCSEAESLRLKKLNPTAENCDLYRSDGKNRLCSYMDIVEHVLPYVRRGENVVVTFYGDPAVRAKSKSHHNRSRTVFRIASSCSRFAFLLLPLQRSIV